jgi:Leucine-rich repeat (LRR) protein
MKPTTIFLIILALSISLFLRIQASNTFLSLEKIYCRTDDAPTLDENEVFNYDCSNESLDWYALNRLIDPIRASTSLNLAFNNLGNQSQIVRNLSFNLFKQLIKLNLTANYLSSIESHAFFYLDKISDNVDTTFLKFLDPSQLNPLHLTQLDLSRNLFQIVPWNSLHHLPLLSQLNLNANPIRTFDMGDWKPPPPPQIEEEAGGGDDELFRNLTEVYLSGALVEYVDPIIIRYLSHLKILDLSGNRIRHLSVELRHPFVSNLNFQYLLINDNPLVCDCKLIWLKEFLERYGDPNRNGRTMCQINTVSNRTSLIVETKFIYINSTYKTNENYFKLTSINHLNGKEKR